jgi:hypothetical protein
VVQSSTAAGGVEVFAVFCPTVGSQVLIWSSEIRAVTNLEDGIRVQFECACGCEGVWHTGAKSVAHDHPCMAPALEYSAA